MGVAGGEKGGLLVILKPASCMHLYMFCSLANSFNHPLRTTITTNMVIIQWSLFSVLESSAVDHYGPDGFPIIATIDTLLLHSSLHQEYTRKKD